MRLSDIERGNPKAERHAKRIAKHQAELSVKRLMETFHQMSTVRLSD